MSGERHALIIATAKYSDPAIGELRAPGHDAEALKRVLADPDVGDFNVDVALDATEAALRRRVAAFFADRASDDLLLLYLSCHGLKDGRGYLFFAATDTDLKMLSATSLPADFVNREMDGTFAERVVLFLDCCYSGAWGRGMRRGDDGIIDLPQHFAGKGKAILTASNAQEYAFEDGVLKKRRMQVPPYSLR